MAQTADVSRAQDDGDFWPWVSENYSTFVKFVLIIIYNQINEMYYKKNIIISSFYKPQAII